MRITECLFFVVGINWRSEMEQRLLQRLFAHSDPATPRFAYQSTVNWMAALSILCDSEAFSPEAMRSFYLAVPRRTVNEEADTWCFENVFMMLHNMEALGEMSRKCEPLPVIRSAIITWYYTIYYAASGMVAAASGAKPETHAETAKTWHSDIAIRGHAIGPFGLHLNTLVPREVKAEVERLREGNRFALTKEATDEADAWGACVAYLSGTAGYEQEKVERLVRASRQFKELGVSNFKTKRAAQLRDARLGKKPVNFLTQASRYRGKANYRDSIYLSYGANRTETLNTFLSNLDNVASSFATMACRYMARRVEKGAWERFVEDLDNNSQITVRHDVLGY
ncbi:hypothetical protein CK501_11335 [Halovibrio salipaludis]|uniref:Uncharacterized protein n=1 Tax=Halovibrio salipaludis TaxID=2032626 RepID=A0A2A2F4B7_9GAMM|nr:hypothetical protein [Halovibrio salipaludis]PAU79788.1 hypothetical protein CK501_11335 [Halovibrio salipaludis]